MPYDDEKWEKYRQTMHWLNPKVSIASRLAFNFAGQTVDFLRHQDDYQMVSAELIKEITFAYSNLSRLEGHNI